MINLQQAFYGRDPLVGYRLLASSDSTHNKTIERLCEKIGTPDGVSIVEPFYINYIDGEWRYMIRGCIGNQDDAGRKTLFFHAYVGFHKEMLAVNFGIGNLIHENAFLQQYEKSPVLVRSFEGSSYSLPWGNVSFMWDHKPLAIISRKPEFDILTGLLKGNINSEKWASFSFQPLEDFRIYVLSEYVSMPSDRKCIDTSGKIRPIEQPSTSRPPPVQQQPTKGSTTIKWERWGLVLSIAVNLFQYFISPATSELDTKNTPLNPEVKTIIKKGPSIIKNGPSISKKGPSISKKGPPKGAVTRQQVLQELRKEFLDNNKRIEGTWDEEIQKYSALKIQRDKHNNELLRRAGKYVDFLNNAILKPGDQK